MSGRANNLLEEFNGPLSDESLFREDSFAEMVDEMEQMSEELHKTRNELWGAQHQLKDSHARIQMLESRLAASERDHSNVRIMQEEQRAFVDTQQRLYEEITMMKDRNAILQGSERQLKKAVELLQSDLTKFREKFRLSESTVRALNVKITKLEVKGKDLGLDAEGTRVRLEAREEQLKEAREETIKLVEEVASLQNELRSARRSAEEKEAELLEKVTKQYKERLTLEVRNLVTKQVTLKVTREVKAEMKVEREKEINIIRDQLKKVFKENSVLNERVEAAEMKAIASAKLHEEVPSLKYQISRLLSTLDTTKKEHEASIAELESFFRIKVQAVHEESAKEKWAALTEMRQQMAKERDREAQDFGSRLEALSRETDKLLGEAARDKDSYGRHIKRRITEEKQREIDVLNEKLLAAAKESREFLKEVQASKVKIAEHVRKDVEEEAQREINKFTHRIETLMQEKDALEKRIEVYEDELSCTWRENERHTDQLKASQNDLKASEDELFKLKRKSHNLNTLVERYKKDNVELSEELKQSKLHFSEALVKSEQRVLTLSEKVKSLEKSTDKTGADPSGTMKELERAKDSIATLEKELSRVKNSLAVSEEDVSKIKDEKQKLRGLIDKVDSNAAKDRETLRQSFKENLESSEGEKSKLREKLEALDPLLEKYKNDFAEISEEFETSTRQFKGALMASENEIVLLKESVKDLTLKIERYRNQNASPIEPEKNDPSKVESEKHMNEGTNENRHLHEKTRGLRQEESKDQEVETDKLRSQIKDLKELLDTYCIEHAELADILDFARHRDSNSEMDSEDDAAMIKEKLHRFGTVLRTYKQKSAWASKELEQSRMRFKEAMFASEREAIQYKERVLNLNSVLSMYKDKHAESTQELELSKRQLLTMTVASDDKVRQLNESIRGLETLLAGSKGARSQFESDLLDAKHQLEEDLKESQDEVSELRENIRNMEGLLEQLEKQHSVMSHEIRNSSTYLNNSKLQLEKALADSQKEVFQLKASSTRFEKVLEQTQKEHADTNKELSLSKRLFNEELMKSEQTIFKLEAKIEKLESSLQQSKNDNLTSIDNLERSKQQVHDGGSSLVTVMNLQESIRNVEAQLHRSKAMHAETIEQFEQSRRKLEIALAASKDETIKQKSAIQTLKLQLDKSKQDNVKISKELQHSMQLFNEALVAWREDTRVLQEQKDQRDGCILAESALSSRQPTTNDYASNRSGNQRRRDRQPPRNQATSDARSVEETSTAESAETSAVSWARIQMDGSIVDEDEENSLTLRKAGITGGQYDSREGSPITGPSISSEPQHWISGDNSRHENQQASKTVELDENSFSQSSSTNVELTALGLESDLLDYRQPDSNDSRKDAITSESEERSIGEDNEDATLEGSETLFSGTSSTLGKSWSKRGQSGELVWFGLKNDSVSLRRWREDEQVQKWQEGTRTLIAELDAAKEHRQKEFLQTKFEDQLSPINETSREGRNPSDTAGTLPMITKIDPIQQQLPERREACEKDINREGADEDNFATMTTGIFQERPIGALWDLENVESFDGKSNTSEEPEAYLNEGTRKFVGTNEKIKRVSWKETTEGSVDVFVKLPLAVDLASRTNPSSVDKSKGKSVLRKRSGAPDLIVESSKSTLPKADSGNGTTSSVARAEQGSIQESKVKSEAYTLNENSAVEETVGDSWTSLAAFPGETMKRTTDTSNQNKKDGESGTASATAVEAIVRPRKNAVSCGTPVARHLRQKSSVTNNKKAYESEWSRHESIASSKEPCMDKANFQPLHDDSPSSSENGALEGSSPIAENGADDVLLHSGPVTILNASSRDSEDSDGSATERMMHDWNSALDDFSAVLRDDESTSRSRLDFSSGSSSEGVHHHQSARNSISAHLDGSDFTFTDDGSSLSETVELKSSVAIMFRPRKKKMVTWQEGFEGFQECNTDGSASNAPVFRPYVQSEINDDSIASSRGDSLESSLKGEHLTLASDGGYSRDDNASMADTEDRMVEAADSDMKDFESRDDEIETRRDEDSTKVITGDASEALFETSSLDETRQYNYVSPDSSFDGTDYLNQLKMMRGTLVEGRHVGFQPVRMTERQVQIDSEDREEARSDSDSGSVGDDDSFVSDRESSWISRDYNHIQLQSVLANMEVANSEGSSDFDDTSVASYLEGKYWDGVLDASLGTDDSDAVSSSASHGLEVALATQNKGDSGSERSSTRSDARTLSSSDHREKSSELKDDMSDNEEREKHQPPEEETQLIKMSEMPSESPSNSGRQSKADSLDSTVERMLVHVGAAQYDYWFGRNDSSEKKVGRTPREGSTSTSDRTGNTLSNASSPHDGQTPTLSDTQLIKGDNDFLDGAVKKGSVGLAVDSVLSHFSLDVAAETLLSYLSPDAPAEKLQKQLFHSAMKIHAGVPKLTVNGEEGLGTPDGQGNGLQRSLRQSRLWNRKGLQLRRFCAQKSYQNKVESLTPTAEDLQQEQRESPPPTTMHQDSLALVDVGEVSYPDQVTALPSSPSSDQAASTLPSESSEPTTATSTTQDQLVSVSSDTSRE
jgi:chromosome segregation ATPase